MGAPPPFSDIRLTSAENHGKHASNVKGKNWRPKARKGLWSPIFPFAFEECVARFLHLSSFSLRREWGAQSSLCTRAAAVAAAAAAAAAVVDQRNSSLLVVSNL